MVGSRWLLLCALSVPLWAAIPANCPADENEATRRLLDLFDSEWERTLRENPTFASELGDLRYNDRWPDVSLEAIGRSHELDRNVLRELDRIDVSQLSAADRLNHELFRLLYENKVGGHQFRLYLRPLTQRGGIQDESVLADSMSFRKVQDYEDWLTRLKALPPYIEQTTALMREGMRRKKVHAKVVMRRVPGQIEKQIVDDPQASLYYKPFREFPEDIAAAEQERLRAAAQREITRSVVPAYREFLRFFNEEYLPACFDKVGVWQMEDGEAVYAHQAKVFTTTDLTPKEIHEIGQAEVRRIRGEMEKIIEQVQYGGTFQEFLQFLRTDRQFYFENPDDLLEAYRAVSKKVDPHLVKLFGKLPRIPYGVEAIPMNMAPDTTTAYYRPPADDGSRAGTYFVNLYRPEVRPKYEIEALSLHEAVPGHHLQIALAMELEHVPTFRRFAGYTAFVEGWGLYSESLGEEIGLYTDPYSKFGQLTYEMWRAVRLVVDTGMHSFGWTRQQAIDFFAENTAKTMLDIENEVDRYISWPGQALAYKIGELKIKELRARAERELGDDFDIRAFHDAVLANGAVPLNVLERLMDEWLKGEKAKLQGR